jgi:hypothetical protein
VEYCEVCDVCYCTKCGEEWGKQNRWYYSPMWGVDYTATVPNDGTIYYKDTAGEITGNSHSHTAEGV